MKPHEYYFIYKENEEAPYNRYTTIKSHSLPEAVEDFNKQRPNKVFIAVYDRTRIPFMGTTI